MSTNAPSAIDKKRAAAQNQVKEFVASAQVNRFEHVAGNHVFSRRADVLPQEARAASDTFMNTHFSAAGFNPFG